jgi:hypothetical protein
MSNTKDRNSTVSSAEWTNHEHVAPAVQTQAQKLVESAGSPGLAKQAIDATSSGRDQLASRKDNFARHWGFQSYLDLFEASTLIRTAAGQNWRLSAVSGGWIVWNEADLRADTVHATKGAAEASVPANDHV